MPLADLYICPHCERPLESTGVIFVRLGKRVTGRRALRKLKREGLHLPRVRHETRRKLECGHHIHIEKRPVFKNWYSPTAPPVVRQGRLVNRKEQICS